MRSLQRSLVLLACVWLPACGGDDGGQTAGTSSTSTSESGATATATETGTNDTTDESGSETGMASCYDGMHAIVTDIDETLTTTDAEFLMQLADSTYDPLERGEASELISDYHARGYFIVYLTARAEAQFSVDDAMIPARDLTEDWLVDHGFPMDEHTTVILATSFVVGDAAAAYKGQALMDLQSQGYMFDYAYGNATSDISGYEMAGIAKDVTFIIGPEGGMSGTMAIPEDDYVMHRAAQIPTVPDFCGG